MSTFPDKHKIIKQGFLQKKSKYVGSWRLRWTVLTDQHLLTFKTKNLNQNPTETIQLSGTTISSFSDLIFQIKGDCNYLFKSETVDDKMKWINCIDKYTHNCIKIPINIICYRDNTFNDNFDLIVPYSDYSVGALITEVMDYVNKTCYPFFKFFATKIKADSFIGRDINLPYCGQSDVTIENITKYEQVILEQVGMTLEIDMEIYQHNVLSIDNICDNMKNANELCPIYAKMKFQDIFTEKYLNHLYEYEH
eukprot:54428_1